MNGGVSLAVWMGGVTHELERLTRCRWDSRPSSAWTTLLEAIESDAVVDMVAGTSAGGLNGALLAAALGSGAPLPSLLEVWMNDGRLERDGLLHKTPLSETASADGNTRANSLLDGAYFAEQIKKQLNKIIDNQDPAQAEDVALIVTATVIGESTRRGEDALGSEFRINDHRRAYKFESNVSPLRWHQQGEWDGARVPKNEFVDRVGELACAARASAGFPFAFDPQQETGPLRALDQIKGSGPTGWLIDGGVLDNAPISQVMTLMRARPRPDVGERWVVYVVPTAKAVPRGIDSGPGTLTPEWTQLPSRLLDLWRESDLREDLDRIVEWAFMANSRAVASEDLISPDTDLVSNPIALATSLMETYRHVLAAQNMTTIQQPTEALSPLGEMPPPEAVADVLELGLCWIPTGLTPTRNFDGEPRWQWGMSTAQRLVLWMSLDAQKVAMTPTADLAAGTGSAPDVADDLARIAWQLDELQRNYSALTRRARAKSRPHLGPLAATSSAILDSSFPEQIHELATQAVKSWASLHQNLSTDSSQPGNAWARLFAAEVASNALAWKANKRPPQFKFLMVSPETRSDLTDLDLSAIRNMPGWGSDKLYGTRYGHFGAFAVRDWKQWDWRWGRVDGALALASALGRDLPPTQLASIKQALLDEILVDEGGVTSSWLAEESYRVVGLSGSEMLRELRDSREVNTEALSDDIAVFLRNAPAVFGMSADGTGKGLTARLGLRGARVYVWYRRRRAERDLAKL